MKSLYFTAILLLFARFAYPQASPGNNLQGTLGKLAAYSETYPQEKVYLHLDKPYYSVGDDIWFKAYVTVGPQNLLSAMSGIVYVDLIGPDNQLVRSLRLPVLSGLSMGDFQLTDSLREGNYRIRAYTNWMRNFDEDLFFHKTVPVGNALTDKLLTYTDFSIAPGGRDIQADIVITELSGRPIANREVTYELEADGRRIARGKTTTDQQGKIYLSLPDKQPVDPQSGRIKLSIRQSEVHTAIHKTIPIKPIRLKNAIQFFPESGQLLAGSMSKVAFKALQPDGKGIAAQGYIADNSGQRVAEFRTDYAGMGYFLLTPETGKTYTAHVTFADSSTTEATLPAALTSGFILSVNNTADKAVFLQVATTPSQATGQTLSVIAQKNGQVYYAAAIEQSKPETGIRIDRSGLPSGVIQLTLLNDQMEPVAERLIFNLNQRDTLPVKLTTNNKTYRPREKVTVHLNTGTPGDSIRIGSFSAAVTDLRKVPVDGHAEDGILAGLLLSPELKGYIETPGYYFNGINKAKQQQLDNLMLTQGWRRIVWKELMNGNLPAIRYEPEKSIRISGKIVKKTGTPAAGAAVTVHSLTDISTILDTITDGEGRFSFDRLAFYDSTRLIVQARNNKGKQNVNILLDELPAQAVGANKNVPDAGPDINLSISDYLKSRDEQFSELQKYGLMDLGYLLDEVTITAKKKPVVRNSANPVGVDYADQVIYGKDLTNCRTMSLCLRARLRMVREPLLILVDGSEVFDLDVVNPEDVEAVEFLRRPEYMHLFRFQKDGSAPKSVIVITTKYAAGNFADMHVPGILPYNPQGLYAAREFYSPDYSQPQEHPDMRDLRSTILWKPDITTDENGQTSFDFYTADEPGTYRITLEGVDASGRIARSVNHIYVNVQAGENPERRDSVSAYFQERLDAYWSEHPAGNLYLHLDKHHYAPRETVWLKAYVLSDTAADNRVLYVRLADEHRNIVLSEQFPMYDVRAHGNLVLPERLREGNYTLYAYTDRMIRLADTNIFVQPLYIRKQTGRRLEAEAFVSDTARLAPREQVSVTARLRDMGAPARGVKGEYQLLAAGREIRYGRLTTNELGETTFRLTYPRIADNESLEVKMLFSSDGDHAEISLQLPHEKTPFRVRVMPEGGGLVDEVPARVAVEVLDIHGNPLAAAVQVLESGQVVAESVTDKQGIAELRLIPRKGVQYIAVVQAGPRVERIPFPEGATGRDYSLRLVYNQGRAEAWVVNRSGPSEVLLALRSRLEALWSRTLRIPAGDSMRIEIPPGIKATALLSLGLFDRDRRLLAERLFLNRKDDYRVDVTTDEQVYGTLKKVTVRLKVTDQYGNPVTANVSAAATEKYRIDSLHQQNIVDVWRYSHLGQSYQRRLFLAARDSNSTALQDALLLTANWPGSGWNDVSGYIPRGRLPQLPYTDGAYGKVIPVGIKSIREIHIQSPQLHPGAITTPVKPAPLRRIPVHLETDGTFYVPASALTAQRGREWTLDIYAIPGQYDTRFSVAWRDPDIRYDSVMVKSTLLRYRTDRYNLAETAPIPPPSFSFDGVNALAEVVIGSPEQRTLSLRHNCPDRICDACGLLNCPVRPKHRPKKGGTYIYDREKELGWRDPLGDSPFGIKVLYLGCGYFRDVNYIKNITIPDAFPLPDYDIGKPVGADYRSTVFWDPNIRTDAEGKAVFSFFTSDVTGRFEVTVEGLDMHSMQPLTGTGSFTVKQDK